MPHTDPPPAGRPLPLVPRDVMAVLTWVAVVAALTVGVLSGTSAAAEAAVPADARPPAATLPVVRTQANVVAEVTFTSGVDRRDPYNEATLDVAFTDPAGVRRLVPAFWAGGRAWRVRYASPLVGTHTFVTVCSDPADVARDGATGLHNVAGSVEVDRYAGDNPLYAHGPVRVTPGKRYLEHADGTPFFWLGDTWWMGLTTRLAWPDEFKSLLADRKAKGFTVVQIVAGLYPDMPAFDPRGGNEAGQPWEDGYARVRPEYFDAADRKIRLLADEGVVPCVVGAWGFHLPWLGDAKMRQHQRYAYARWGALPVVWCAAGELSLPYYTSPDFPNKGQKQAAAWEPVLRYVRSINAFGRPVTAHPNGVAPNSMRGFLSDPGLIDLDMLQTPHGQMEAVAPAVRAARFSYAATPVMPTVNAEPSYEMLFDRTPAAVARRVFWASWASGVKGYTYGANGIWQLNRRDKPYGNSPWGGGYGKIAWDDAMHLPGSAQVGLAKKLLSGYPWHLAEPHPEWAAWADAPLPVSVGGWIWYPEAAAAGPATNPAEDAAVAARFFRGTFDLPADRPVTAAALAIAADDRCTVWVNGYELGTHEDWHTLRRFDGVGPHLRPGRNVVAVRAENVASAVAKNPAGLTCGVTVRTAAERGGGGADRGRGGRADVGRLVFAADGTWRASAAAPPGWERHEFVDADWPRARVVAPAGGGPWGAAPADPARADPAAVPHAFGVAEGARFAYVPTARAVAVAGLPPGRRYTTFAFDPVAGDRRPLPDVTGDAGGAARVEPPPRVDDWVLVLEPAAAAAAPAGEPGGPVEPAAPRR